MSLLPVAVHADRLRALVVGAGRVGTFKATTLLSLGARVRVVATEISAELESLAQTDTNLTLVRALYDANQIGDANFVFAATSSVETNGRVAEDARAMGRLVNVADGSGDSDFHSMAVHRAANLVIGVTATRVPGVARAVRDAIAARFDQRYGDAVEQIAALRARLLETSGSEAWHSAATAVFGEDLCAAIESGQLEERLAAWR